MGSLLRHITLVAVAVSMTLTALTVGHARGQAPAAGQIVICIGADVVTITVDEDGQPTMAGHICPDCVLKLTGPLVVPPDVVSPYQLSRVVFDAQHVSAPPALSLIEDRARAPPRIA